MYSTAHASNVDTFIQLNSERWDMRIEIFSKANCPNCRIAKQLLLTNNLDYVEYDIAQAEVMSELLLRNPNAKQMPQIFIDSQHVGGLAGLQAALDLIV
jgi:glutaredoxin